MTFWIKKWKNKFCGITQTRLRPGKNKQGNTYSIFLDCKHGFYRSVLIEWIKHCPTNNLTCPTCRKEFVLNVMI
jgi:hypothetical protein|tara:strand:- start:370 stop:591 length:222 start_codon:yes stop_codon:yes gene_type:complete